MFKTLIISGLLISFSLAQPYRWSETYNPSAQSGGVIRESAFGDITTLNPYLSSSATEAAVLGMYAGPSLIYRDWIGNRSFKRDDGSYNLYFAKSIEEVKPEQEFIVTLREGWMWSDGVEMTADDALAARTIIGDPAVEANSFTCSVVGDDPVIYEKLGTYQYKISLPKPQVNALASFDCGIMPAHVFMPVYQSQGAEGIKDMWGVDTEPSEIISGGPFMLTEFRAGERLVMKKNLGYGAFVKAADDEAIGGPDEWVLTLTQDQNAELALVTTGQTDFYWPKTLDQVAALQQAVSSGVIPGNFYPDISPSTSIDFITYNFNSSDPCKASMFRNQGFRQAISIMIDRNALVDTALGGLGFPANDQNTEANAPFVADLPAFEFNPEAGVKLLNSIGFTELGSDGVLTNPATGCRAEFTLQTNAGNNRRSQQALVIAQTLEPYGVNINPIEVSTEAWQDAIIGNTIPRVTDYDAQIWGLAGGDIDNPSAEEVWRLAANLNSWNKDKVSAEAWEILLDRMTTQMSETLDLEQRIAIYQERAKLMRDYLPITPLIAQSFHYYENTAQEWSRENLDAVSIQEPYRPGNFRENITIAR
jgi:peptide/nickel transport system substrate-binding protein